MKRAARGKLLKITQRDIAIFRLLTQYRYLSSDFIHAFVGGVSATRFKERLGDLFHEGYLDRPEQQWQLPDARCSPAIHEAGWGVDRVLGSLCETGCSRTYLGATASRQFVHALLICEVLASIEIEARVTPGLRFIPWAEILSRAPETTRSAAKPFAIPVPCSREALIPDALFGLEYSNGAKRSYRFFALEIDRATMPVRRGPQKCQTSFAAKLDRYRRIIEARNHKGHLGIPNLLVLTLSTGESHLGTMIESARAGSPAGAAFFFKTLPNPSMVRGLRHPLRTLVSHPWRRPGLEPLSIGAP